MPPQLAATYRGGCRVPRHGQGARKLNKQKLRQAGTRPQFLLWGRTEKKSWREETRQVAIAAWRVLFNGILIMLKSVSIRDISDGTSKTIIVESSRIGASMPTGSKADCRADCGHGFPHGAGPDGLDRAFNTTCVLHRINEQSHACIGRRGQLWSETGRSNRSYRRCSGAPCRWFRAIPGRRSRS